MTFIRRTKYNAKKIIIDGLIFASQKEGRRYQDLKFLQKIGYVDDLKLQVTYVLSINNYIICKYIADFVYTEGENKERVVEDVKGMKTGIYRLKKKLMKAIHNIEIRET